MHAIVLPLLPAALAASLLHAWGAESFDRGLIALATTDDHVYRGWRLLAEDPPDVTFDVLRRQREASPLRKLNAQPIADSCNFVEASNGAANAACAPLRHAATARLRPGLAG